MKIRDLIDHIESGVSVRSFDQPATHEQRGVLKVSAVSGGRFDHTKNKLIRDDEVARAATNPKMGCTLVSRANTTLLVGESAFVEKSWPSIYLSDKLWQLHPNKDLVDPRWLSLLLASAPVRERVRLAATGTSGSMKNISQSSYLNIEVLVPALHYQRDAVNAARSMDKVWRRLSQALELRRTRRLGLSRELLAGRRRIRGFAGEIHRSMNGTLPSGWRRVRIGELATQASVRARKAVHPVLTCTKDRGLVPSLEYFDRQVFSRNLGSYKVVRRNDLVYATNHVEEGSLGLLLDCDAGLVSPMYTVFTLTDPAVAPEFLYGVLKTEQLTKTFKRMTSGSVNRRGGLRWSMFRRIEILLPSKEEQERIVSILDVLDREIALLEQQREAYERLKRAVMHRLLSGDFDDLDPAA